MSEIGIVEFPRHGKQDAVMYAERGTRYLSRHGCNQILMAVHKGKLGWFIEVPADVLTIWPNLADLLTE